MATMQNKNQVSTLRNRIGASFETRLRDVAGWRVHLDESQVLWSQYVPLDFDTGEPSATAQAISDATVSVEGLVSF